MVTLPASSTKNPRAAAAISFWREFTSDTSRSRIVFGRNVYTEELIKAAPIDAVVDDFAPVGTRFHDRPVVKSADIPKDSLVIAASGGRPLTVRRLLNSQGIENFDYFAIAKHAAPHLREMLFNENFTDEYERNSQQYDWLRAQLADERSAEILEKLIAFRRSADLDYLEGFIDRQKEQYFEEFLGLQRANEVFVDVGCFDGYTTLQFCNLCPDYSHVFAFEPDPDNFANCSVALQNQRDITLLPFAAGEHASRSRISKQGSASTISDCGDTAIALEKMDDVLTQPPTFIKFDTEGGEAAALRGGAMTIATHTPRLAVAAYHKPGDFWALPRIIKDYCEDYSIFIRHYTESIYETVFFFVPKKES
jgi:FkbM family methyltransferase